MTEMIATEQEYVRALRFIIDNYVPLLLRDDVPQALRGQSSAVFGNIENIYAFHSQHFVKEVEGCRHNPFRLSHCFLDHEEHFYLYALYNKNKPRSDELLADPHISHFFRQKQLQLNDKMDLASYLLKPVQRMGKYSLLLKQVMKECPVTAPELQDLKSAHVMVKFQLRHGNDLLAMDCLQGSDVSLELFLITCCLKNQNINQSRVFR